MAKKPFSRDKIMVRQVEAVPDLIDLIAGCTLDALIQRLGHLRDVCGGDSRLCIGYSEYYGIEAEVIFMRLETDFEHQRRVDAHDRAELRRANRPPKPSAEERAAAKKQKEIHELVKKARELGIQILGPIA